jgi:lantibiotic transport system ATP-binding protein
MQQYCLQTQQLSHTFNNGEKVLNNINLHVPQGSIYGFLGPNGAGKTTTLKLVLGLLQVQQGSINIFQQSIQKQRRAILQQTGSLIESPSLYGHLSAIENLQVMQKVYQCTPQRIQDVLQLVGLPNTGKKKVHQFSLGMKQRLSIAIALLHQPKLLILDEPTNGLDPTGIIEMRELLKKLNHVFGVTIIISSHLLSEIEKLVTHVGVINKGQMLFEGTLLQLEQKQQQGASTSIHTNNQIDALRLIRDVDSTATIVKEHVVIPTVNQQIIAAINKQLVNNDIEVYQITTVKNDLETIFINMVNTTV